MAVTVFGISKTDILANHKQGRK